MTPPTSPGTFHVVGVGPGDPELISVKAARIIGAAPVVAYIAKHNRAGHAHTIAQPYLRPATELLRLEYPYTTEISWRSDAYQTAMHAFYDTAAAAITARLAAGQDVALLCEGDPFFYGSSMYVYDRLAAAGHRIEVTPGIIGMSGCWANAQLPMLHGDDVMSVLPGTLSAEDLAHRLAACDAAVIMKLGRNLPKVREALAATGRADRALYIEHGTMANQRIIPLAGLTDARVPYFSLILVPGRLSAR